MSKTKAEVDALVAEMESAVSQVRVVSGRFFWIGRAHLTGRYSAGQQAMVLDGDDVELYQRRLIKTWGNGSPSDTGTWRVARGGWKFIEGIPYRHLLTLAAQGGRWGKLSCADLLVQLDAFLEKHPPKGPTAFERDGVGRLL